MDPVVVLADTRLQVEPGDQATTTVTVRNAGNVVEQFEFQVLGAAAAWSDVLPPEVSVLPGAEQTVEVVFRPPRDPSTPAGEVPFGLRCMSREDPGSMAVVEGDLVVGGLLDLDAQLTPATGHGRWRSRHRVTLANRGTVPAHLHLSVADPDEALAFKLSPTLLTVPPAGSAEVGLTLRTRHPALRGQPQRHPFQVTYQRLAQDASEAAGSGTLDGTFEQRPIVSKLVLGAAAAAVAGVAALGFLLLRDGGDATAAAGGFPDHPGQPEAVALSSDRIRLSWADDPNAAGYEAQRLSDDGQTEAVEPVPKGQEAFIFTDLEPARSYCFQLVALGTGDFRSDPSERACTETAAPGVIPPPQGVDATVEEDRSVRVSWEDLDPQAAHVIVLDGADLQTTGPGVSGVRVPDVDPGPQRCFRVAAEVDGERSELSEPACVAVEEPVDGTGGGGTGGDETTTTTGPTDTTDTTDGDGETDGNGVEEPQGVFVLYQTFDPSREDDARELVAILEEAGFQAKVGNTGESAVLDARLSGSVDLWVVFEDGFGDGAEAQEACDTYTDPGRERGDRERALAGDPAFCVPVDPNATG